MIGFQAGLTWALYLYYMMQHWELFEYESFVVVVIDELQLWALDFGLDPIELNGEVVGQTKVVRH